MDRRELLPLTSLRFVAAAMILFHHSALLGVTPSTLPLDQGVSFFFVLSGFILAYRYPSLSTWAEVKRFLAFRIIRIFPAHAVTAVAMIFIFSAPVDFKLIPNLLMVHGWIPIWPYYFSYNSVSWSISTEFFFYLAFPVLIIAWPRTFWWKLPLVAALPVGLMVVGRELQLPQISAANVVTMHGLLYISPLARLLEFVAGMAASVAFRSLVPTFVRR